MVDAECFSLTIVARPESVSRQYNSPAGMGLLADDSRAGQGCAEMPECCDPEHRTMFDCADWSSGNRVMTCQFFRDHDEQLSIPYVNTPEKPL